MHAKWLASLVLWVAVFSLAPRAAHAWQQVKSGSGGTKVLATPAPDANVSGNVDPGKALTIGDKPTNGFYRCNAGKGLNGWCEESELDFGAKGAPKGIQEARNATARWRKGSGALDSNIYVGGLLGFGFYSGGTKFTFGVDGGYKLGPSWALGLYGTYTSTSSTVGTVTASGSSIIIAPELNYFLEGELKGLHLGAKAGLDFSSSSASTGTGGVLPAGASGSTSTTGFVFGAAAGYDYPITHDITIGGEANFLIITSGGGSASATTGGTTTTTSTTSSSSSVFHILASVKYWL